MTINTLFKEIFRYFSVIKQVIIKIFFVVILTNHYVKKILIKYVINEGKE
jgi:hypothetical protein